MTGPSWTTGCASWSTGCGPRGIAKGAARLDRWMKDAAPSAALRKWYGHDPEKWPEFKRRFAEELDRRPQVIAELMKLRAGQGRITLLTAARDRGAQPRRRSEAVSGARSGKDQGDRRLSRCPRSAQAGTMTAVSTPMVNTERAVPIRDRGGDRRDFDLVALGVEIDVHAGRHAGENDRNARPERVQPEQPDRQQPHDLPGAPQLDPPRSPKPAAPCAPASRNRASDAPQSRRGRTGSAAWPRRGGHPVEPQPGRPPQPARLAARPAQARG